MDTSITPCNLLLLSPLQFILSLVALTLTFLLFYVFPFLFTVGEGTSSMAHTTDADSPVVPHTPDYASFELAPSLSLLK